jgi:predicted dehydrogenase/threonine dehydrogenase-like Zn-dependent dehydrogenase
MPMLAPILPGFGRRADAELPSDRSTEVFELEFAFYWLLNTFSKRQLMRQVLMNSKGGIVARMPRPAVEHGSVLVRVSYSLISSGTELAPLRATVAAEGATAMSSAKAYTSLARRYIGKALRNPGLAAQRAGSMARRAIDDLRLRHSKKQESAFQIGGLTWTRCGAREFHTSDDRLELLTDNSEFSYQAISQAIDIPAGHVPMVEVRGRVHQGVISLGLLNSDRSAWLGSRNYDQGSFEDQLVFNPGNSPRFSLVVANAGARAECRVTLDSVRIMMVSQQADALPVTELEDQGWSVGYSAAGEVVAVGEGISDLLPGDRVACAGAGKANHADYVSVPRNLVCRVPEGCDTRLAATTTVGAIALQGLRRANPQIGETVCVIGLGLIGQLTAQMLHANGCRAIGFDLEPSRVARATALGMSSGTSTDNELLQTVRDLTGGKGADRTIVAASTKSDAVINLAMEVTRSKGVVVIVGDVGLNVRREIFYKKEIDLLMSTSYGPGRYDRSYEEQGNDYPFAYVRWTLNRNMQAYMELIAARRIDVGALIDKVVPVHLAPEAYKSLAAGANGPLGVLIRYPEDTRKLPEPPDASRIVIRGHKAPTQGLIKYALVGVGAFGTSMLVPMMQKVENRFFLRGLVSRNAVAAGNFARANRVEVLATELNAVLSDPGFDLVVIATRHHEHSRQVIRSLKAGKHVFVEKPLATSWNELDEIVSCYQDLSEKPVLLVGFNRRFSPGMQMLKNLLKDRRSPCVINYRLNGGYIPVDSWIQGEQGKGRNIGEACHMYDVFRFLAGSPVVSISATPIDPASLPYLRNDNFCATLAYADGTVGNLVYTALGPKQGLAKERVEVFCDGEAYIVDDYKSLSRASDGNVLWQSPTADKGHLEEMSRLGAAIAGAACPIPFDEIVESTAVSLHIEDLLHGRSGELNDEA